MEISEELVNLVGNLHEPLRKLRRDEKKRLRSLLNSGEVNAFVPAWRIRLFIAAGLTLTSTPIDQSILLDALTPSDIVKNLGRLRTEEKTIHAAAAILALEQALDSISPHMALAAVSRLVHQAGTTSGATAGGTPPKLSAETAIAALSVARKLVPALQRRAGRKFSSEAKRKRPSVWRALIDLAFAVADGSENPRVAARAIELLNAIEKQAGWSYVESLDEVTRSRRSRLLTLPLTVLPNLLRNGSIAEAGQLASRLRGVEDLESSFRIALTKLLRDRNFQIPLPSRIWAENFVDQEAAFSRVPTDIKTDSPANLERLATLLLASWEATGEGNKSLSLFELFRSICQTSYHLSLAGDVESTVPFDPAIHEVYKDNVLYGQEVKVTRPRVDWSNGSVVRVIVKALVVPVDIL